MRHDIFGLSEASYKAALCCQQRHNSKTIEGQDYRFNGNTERDLTKDRDELE